jgi:hypothetical protein
MALTWSVKEIANQDDVCWFEAQEDEPMHGIKKGESYLAPLTNAFIWHSLNTGIGRITAENAGEVYARISFVETLYGASLWTSEGPKPITMDDVTMHIGLTTNASFKDESRTSFLKRHAASKLDDSVRNYKAHVKRQAEQAEASV